MSRARDYAEDFRVRAEELRSLATLATHQGVRELLLRCADDYEKMADHYETAAAQGGSFRPPWPE